MKAYKIYGSTLDQRAIDDAVATMRDGGIIIYPTDTVYALGCDALNNRAIERLCAFKGINPDKQLLSVICSDISQASEYAKIDNHAFKLLKDNTPGAFTFILPASNRLPKVFKGRKTVGVRVPDNDIATALANTLGNPLLTASVNVDPESPEDSSNPDLLKDEYQWIADLIIDGGEGGTEFSTIVDCTDSSDPLIIRQGKGELA